MPKKQKRVSFSVPVKKQEKEKQEKEEEQKHAVRVSIAEQFDDDIETAENVIGLSDDASDSNSDDSSFSSDSESEQHVEHPKITKNSKRAAKQIVKKKRGLKTHQTESADDEPFPRVKNVKRLSSKRDRSSESELGSDRETDPKKDDKANFDASSRKCSDPIHLRRSPMSEDDSASEKPDESSEGEKDETDASSEGEEDVADESSESEEDEARKAVKSAGAERVPDPIATFGEMGLDARVERAIERMGWKKPTPVQSAVIPAAMAGRDVLVSAPTGSGKTAAYAIPVVQHFCQVNDLSTSNIRCIILVPTRDLVHQASTVLKRMCKYIEGVRVGSVAGKERVKAGQGGLSSLASDILIATPSALMTAANKDENNALERVQLVIVDEADLVLSYGYEQDTRAVLSQIPNTSQSVLLSATLDANGMDAFRKAVLRRPLTIKVTADDKSIDEDQTGATHYYARLKAHKDRYLVTYAMLRLKVICGKVLIFVNHINTAFRLKLFLDQFRLKSAVLNAELPSNSRVHCVEQFNAGVFEILIATDESKREISGTGTDEKKNRKPTRKRRRVERDEEFGLSRGVDFKDVAAVLNFDLPESFTKYAHRAGRTARAGKSGTVLTLVCQDKEEIAVLDMGRQLGTHIGPLAFRMDQIEALRYRVESSLRLVTDTAVHGARLADVRREIVNSEALKNYFEDNPQDLDALQHNLSLAKNIPAHLGHIPSYLLPPALRGNANRERQRAQRKGRGGGQRGKRDRMGSADPLKSFSTGVAGSSRQRYRTKHGINTRKKDLGRAIGKRKRTY